MKTSFLLRYFSVLLTVLFLASEGKTQGCISCTTSPCLALRWANSYDDAFNKQDYGKAITTDASGYSYVTGQSTVTAGSPADRSVVTIKYDPTGSIVSGWPQIYGHTNSSPYDDGEAGNAIAVDGSGNVWVAATLQNGTTYKYDMALLEYNSSGVLQTGYPKYYAEASTYYDFTEAITLVVKDATHVYVGGTSVNGTSYYGKVLMNNPSGGWYWTYTFSGSNLTNTPHNETCDMKLNSAGTYLYVTGEKNNGTAGGDVFLAKIDASTTGGSASWTQTYAYGGGGDDLSNAIYVDGSDNCYLAGSTYVSLSQLNNAFIMKYNSSGALQWISTYNSVLNDAYVDIGGTGTDSRGDAVIYTTGYRTISNSNQKNADYITAAYLISTGALSTGWSQNPKIYDGSAAGNNSNGGEPLGTDRAYALEYDATNNKVFVTGVTFDSLCPGQNNINITTLRYAGTTGALEWNASYDYGSDAINWKDDVTSKNALAIQNNVVCTGVDAFVNGDHLTTSAYNDYITIKYSFVCCHACGAPEGSGDPGKLGNDQFTGAGIYPDPFTGNATLKVAGPAVINGVLMIYDISGKEVREISSINSNSIQIEQGNMPNGIYYFRLSDVNGEIASGKFVISE
jgi:hypothetical protein